MRESGCRLATVGTAIAVLFCSMGGAQPAKQSSALGGADVSDSVICSTNSFDRTRPFLIGEKTVYFVNLRDGDRVKSPFRVAFAVSGMGVSPVKAGELVNTGHHHILIDQPIPVDIKAPIPFDKADEFEHQHYKHFGGGETETVLSLPPGRHTLRLLFANHQHIPYYMGSKEITIEVVSSGQ
jgi:hypothetical protein